MLKPEHEAFTKTLITLASIVVSTLVSAAVYMLIVRLILIKIFDLSTADDGGYSMTFGETLFLTLVMLAVGYLLFLVIRFILRIRSHTSRIVLGALCMPAAYIGLFYTGFGVPWFSPTTYVYLLLLIASGAFIIYIPDYFIRRFRSAN